MYIIIVDVHSCLYKVHCTFLLHLYHFVYMYMYMPRAIERSNLLNMAKLTVKSLIESSMRFGRTLADDHPPLQQLLIAVELVLRHKLKGMCKCVKCTFCSSKVCASV